MTPSEPFAEVSAAATGFASVVAPSSRMGAERNDRSGNERNDGNDGNHSTSPRLAVVPGKANRSRLRERPEKPLFETVGGFMERTASLPEPRSLFPPEGVARPLIPDAGRVLVTAPASSGKTFFEMVVAKAAAAAGRPAYLVFEEGAPRATGDRFRSLAFDASLPVHVAHLRGARLTDRSVMEQLKRALKSHEAPLLALDPFTSLAGGVDENDTREMGVRRDLLDELVRENDRAVILLAHHTNKASDESAPSMNASRGSNALPAWADVQLYLRHTRMPKDSRCVAFVATVVKSREGERDYSVRVKINLSSGEVFCDDVDDDGAGKEDRVGRVLEVAGAAPGLSRDALAKRAGGNKKMTIALIDRLAGEGSLERTQGSYFIARAPKVSP